MPTAPVDLSPRTISTIVPALAKENEKGAELSGHPSGDVAAYIIAAAGAVAPAICPRSMSTLFT
jgi:hypothetical protein